MDLGAWEKGESSKVSGGKCGPKFGYYFNGKNMVPNHFIMR